MVSMLVGCGLCGLYEGGEAVAFAFGGGDSRKEVEVERSGCGCMGWALIFLRWPFAGLAVLASDAALWWLVVPAGRRRRHSGCSGCIRLRISVSPTLVLWELTLTLGK